MLEQIGSLISLAGVVLIARPTSLFTVGGSQDTIGNSVDGAPAMNATAPSESDASSYENVTPVQRLTAVGIALIGVVGSTMAYTTIRWIGRRAHPLITVNYFSGWCLFVSIVMQSVLPDVGWVLPADLKEWGYLIFLGTCGFAMVGFALHDIDVLSTDMEQQFLMATALAYEKSSRTTNMVDAPFQPFFSHTLTRCLGVQLHVIRVAIRQADIQPHAGCSFNLGF